LHPRHVPDPLVDPADANGVRIHERGEIGCYQRGRVPVALCGRIRQGGGDRRAPGACTRKPNINRAIAGDAEILSERVRQDAETRIAPHF